MTSPSSAGSGRRQGLRDPVGGGTSIMPRSPHDLDFVEAETAIISSTPKRSCGSTTARAWLRPNRARARIKVPVDKVGIEEVRRMVDEELKGDWVNERDFTIDHLVFDVDEEASLTEPRPRAARRTATAPNSTATSKRTSSRSAGGLPTVEVKVVRGDLTPEQFRGLARSCGTTPAASPG